MKRMILKGSPKGTGTQLCCDKYNMITHCLFTILLVLFLAIVPLVGYAEMIVGTDIAKRDIVDFCYTYSTSTAVPFYQRYRFYLEDGKKFFTHETREGGGWPQTEEDITFSGTIELTEADWAAFFACISEGEVRQRSDDLLAADVVQQGLPDLPEGDQRFTVVGNIEENPIVRIADIQLRITRLDHVLVDRINETSTVLLSGITASRFQTLSRPEDIELQEDQQLTDPLVGG